MEWLIIAGVAVALQFANRLGGPGYCPACTIKALHATAGSYKFACTHCKAEFVRIGIRMERTDAPGDDGPRVPMARLRVVDRDNPDEPG